MQHIQDQILCVIYLYSGRPEKRSQRGAVSDLGLIGAVIRFYCRQQAVIENKCVSAGDEKKVGVMDLDLFKRKLHILFVIIVVQVFTPVMHRKEVDEAYFLIYRLVFQIMPDQRGGFHHLIQRSCIQDDDHQHDISDKSFHVLNLGCLVCIRKGKCLSVHALDGCL